MLIVVTAVPLFLQSAPGAGGVALAAPQPIQPGNNSQVQPLQVTGGLDLILSKHHTNQNFQIGSTVSFDLIVSNQSDTAAEGTITVVDDFPTGLQYSGFSGSEWTCTPPSSTVYVPEVTCTWNNTVLAAEVGNVPTTTGTLVISVVVLKTAFPSVINQAHLTFTPASGKPNQVNNVNDCANYTGTCPGDTVAVTGAPDLTVSFPNPSQPPQTFVINNPTPVTIRVSNIGSADTVGTTQLTVDLPSPEFSFATTQPAFPSGWTCPSVSGQSTTCSYSPTIPAVAGGGTAPDITLNVLPTQGLSGTKNITATVSGGGEPGVNQGNNSVSIAVTTGQVVQAPNLSIAKAAPATMTVGVPAVITFTVANSGASTLANQPITITDTLPQGLTLTTATTNPSTAFPQGNWTSCTQNGQVVTCTFSNQLAGGASTSVNIAVVASNTAVSPSLNTAIVSTYGQQNKQSNQTSTNIVTVALSATKTASAASFNIGPNSSTTQSFTLGVTNTGTGPTVGDVTVSDTLPAGVTLDVTPAVTGAGYSCSAVGQVVSCTITTILQPSSANSVSIVLPVDVSSTVAGTISNTATFTTPGSTTTAATGSITINKPNFTVNKSHAGNFVQGTVGQYFINVNNTGAGKQFGPITVTDVLPAALSMTAPNLTSTNGASTDWTCTYDQPTNTLTCNYVGGVNNGNFPATSNSTITVFVTANQQTTVTNQAQLTLTTGYPSPVTIASNNDSTVIQPPPPPDVQVIKTHTPIGNVQVAVPFTWVLHVENFGTGPTVSGAPITVTDQIPASFTIGTITPANVNWVCPAPVGQTITCTWPAAAGTLGARALAQPMLVTSTSR